MFCFARCSVEHSSHSPPVITWMSGSVTPQSQARFCKKTSGDILVFRFGSVFLELQLGIQLPLFCFACLSGIVNGSCQSPRLPVFWFFSEPQFLSPSVGFVLSYSGSKCVRCVTAATMYQDTYTSEMAFSNVGHLPSGQMLSGQKPSGYMPSGH